MDFNIHNQGKELISSIVFSNQLFKSKLLHFFPNSSIFLFIFVQVLINIILLAIINFRDCLQWKEDNIVIYIIQIYNGVCVFLGLLLILFLKNNLKTKEINQKRKFQKIDLISCDKILYEIFFIFKIFFDFILFHCMRNTDNDSFQGNRLLFEYSNKIQILFLFLNANLFHFSKIGIPKKGSLKIYHISLILIFIGSSILFSLIFLIKNKEIFKNKFYELILCESYLIIYLLYTYMIARFKNKVLKVKNFLKMKLFNLKSFVDFLQKNIEENSDEGLLIFQIQTDFMENNNISEKRINSKFEKNNILKSSKSKFSKHNKTSDITNNLKLEIFNKEYNNLNNDGKNFLNFQENQKKNSNNCNLVYHIKSFVDNLKNVVIQHYIITSNEKNRQNNKYEEFNHNDNIEFFPKNDDNYENSTKKKNNLNKNKYKNLEIKNKQIDLNQPFKNENHEDHNINKIYRAQNSKLKNNISKINERIIYSSKESKDSSKDNNESFSIQNNSNSNFNELIMQENKKIKDLKTITKKFEKKINFQTTQSLEDTVIIDSIRNFNKQQYLYFKNKNLRNRKYSNSKSTSFKIKDCLLFKNSKSLINSNNLSSREINKILSFNQNSIKNHNISRSFSNPKSYYAKSIFNLDSTKKLSLEIKPVTYNNEVDDKFMNTTNNINKNFLYPNQSKLSKLTSGIEKEPTNFLNPTITFNNEGGTFITLRKKTISNSNLDEALQDNIFPSSNISFNFQKINIKDTYLLEQYNPNINANKFNNDKDNEMSLDNSTILEERIINFDKSDLVQKLKKYQLENDKKENISLRREDNSEFRNSNNFSNKNQYINSINKTSNHFSDSSFLDRSKDFEEKVSDLNINNIHCDYIINKGLINKKKDEKIILRFPSYKDRFNKNWLSDSKDCNKDEINFMNSIQKEFRKKYNIEIIKSEDELNLNKLIKNKSSSKQMDVFEEEKDKQYQKDKTEILKTKQEIKNYKSSSMKFLNISQLNKRYSNKNLSERNTLKYVFTHDINNSKNKDNLYTHFSFETNSNSSSKFLSNSSRKNSVSQNKTTKIKRINSLDKTFIEELKNKTNDKFLNSPIKENEKYKTTYKHKFKEEELNETQFNKNALKYLKEVNNSIDYNNFIDNDSSTNKEKELYEIAFKNKKGIIKENLSESKINKKNIITNTTLNQTIKPVLNYERKNRKNKIKSKNVFNILNDSEKLKSKIRERKLGKSYKSDEDLYDSDFNAKSNQICPFLNSKRIINEKKKFKNSLIDKKKYKTSNNQIENRPDIESKIINIDPKRISVCKDFNNIDILYESFELFIFFDLFENEKLHNKKDDNDDYLNKKINVLRGKTINSPKFCQNDLINFELIALFKKYKFYHIKKFIEELLLIFEKADDFDYLSSIGPFYIIPVDIDKIIQKNLQSKSINCDFSDEYKRNNKIILSKKNKETYIYENFDILNLLLENAKFKEKEMLKNIDISVLRLIDEFSYQNKLKKDNLINTNNNNENTLSRNVYENNNHLINTSTKIRNTNFANHSFFSNCLYKTHPENLNLIDKANEKSFDSSTFTLKKSKISYKKTKELGINKSLKKINQTNNEKKLLKNFLLIIRVHAKNFKNNLMENIINSNINQNVQLRTKKLKFNKNPFIIKNHPKKRQDNNFAKNPFFLDINKSYPNSMRILNGDKISLNINNYSPKNINKYPQKEKEISQSIIPISTYNMNGSIFSILNNKSNYKKEQSICYRRKNLIKQLSDINIQSQIGNNNLNQINFSKNRLNDLLVVGEKNKNTKKFLKNGEIKNKMEDEIGKVLELSPKLNNFIKPSNFTNIPIQNQCTFKKSNFKRSQTFIKNKDLNTIIKTPSNNSRFFLQRNKTSYPCDIKDTLNLNSVDNGVEKKLSYSKILKASSYNTNGKISSNSNFINEINEFNEILSKRNDNNSFNNSNITDFNFEYNHNYKSSKIQTSDFYSKLSALLHDFKHIVYDNMIYFDYLILKYIQPLIDVSDSDRNIKIYKNFKSNNEEINKLKDELIYLGVIKDFTISLILNITSFMSENEFLSGNLDEPIDIIDIINLMVKIFNRRLEYENAMIEKIEVSKGSMISSNENINTNFISKLKNIIIHKKILHVDIINNLKLISNKNLIISLLYNIISNSYKYTENGEILIEADTCKIDEVNYIIIKISDTGKGIPQEILNNWGKPFNFKDKTVGTGLGQFLINSISKKLMFKILKPESNQFSNSGTVFKILIPVINVARSYYNSDFNMNQKMKNITNTNKIDQNFSSNSNLNKSSILQDQTFNFNNEDSNKNTLTRINNNNEIKKFINISNLDSLISNIKKNQFANNGLDNSSNLTVLFQNLNFNIDYKLRKLSLFNNINTNEIKSLRSNPGNNSSSNFYEYDRRISKLSEIEDTKFLNKVSCRNCGNLNFNERNLNISIKENHQAQTITNFPNLTKSTPIINKTNYKAKNSKAIYILCLDDEQIYLRMVEKKLKDLALEFKQFQFHLIFTNCAQDFFKEFLELLFKNIKIDFFIMDQNISQNMKGIDCCVIANEFYKLYFKDSYSNLKFQFFFVTEEINLSDFKIMQSKKNLVRKDHIFGKLLLKNLIEKLKLYLEE